MIANPNMSQWEASGMDNIVIGHVVATEDGKKVVRLTLEGAALLLPMVFPSVPLSMPDHPVYAAVPQDAEFNVTVRWNILKLPHHRLSAWRWPSVN